MNAIRNTSAALLLSTLAFTALPAGAVSFNNTFFASRFDNLGSSFTNMTPRNTTFCYLSSVSIEETDTGNEEATCRVTRGAVVWTLEAILDKTSDADAECAAVCINN